MEAAGSCRETLLAAVCGGGECDEDRRRSAYGSTSGLSVSNI
jgi:hypothetical protein